MDNNLPAPLVPFSVPATASLCGDMMTLGEHTPHTWLNRENNALHFCAGKSEVPAHDESGQPALDMFRQVFESQAYFQRLLGHDYGNMSLTEQVDYLKGQILALLDETHEALNEMGWKPWASSRHLNSQEFAGELADILCFLVNLALGVGLTADNFFQLHQEKALRNIKRQEQKYDGVAGKCPVCRRAIDDMKAKGIPTGNFGGVDYCSMECLQVARHVE